MDLQAYTNDNHMCTDIHVLYIAINIVYLLPSATGIIVIILIINEVTNQMFSSPNKGCCDSSMYYCVFKTTITDSVFQLSIVLIVFVDSTGM